MFVFMLKKIRIFRAVLLFLLTLIIVFVILFLNGSETVFYFNGTGMRVNNYNILNEYEKYSQVLSSEMYENAVEGLLLLDQSEGSLLEDSITMTYGYSREEIIKANILREYIKQYELFKSNIIENNLFIYKDGWKFLVSQYDGILKILLSIFAVFLGNLLAIKNKKGLHLIELYSVNNKKYIIYQIIITILITWFFYTAAFLIIIFCVKIFYPLNDSYMSIRNLFPTALLDTSLFYQTSIIYFYNLFKTITIIMLILFLESLRATRIYTLLIMLFVVSFSNIFHLYNSTGIYNIIKFLPFSFTAYELIVSKSLLEIFFDIFISIIFTISFIWGYIKIKTKTYNMDKIISINNNKS